MEHIRIESIGVFGAEVARRVREIRLESGVSLAEVSRRTGGRLNELAIRRIENLARRVDVDDLFRLAGALETSVTNLLGSSGIMQYGSFDEEDSARLLAEVERERRDRNS